ncbi:MAG TPA: nitrous oxide reductase family maturation protein NosD [Gemmatimonadaceae bacterium]|nr:nitrous oxide reductase family maturation protein NosD [Gemmatimonadaceae bacterium]
MCTRTERARGREHAPLASLFAIALPFALAAATPPLVAQRTVTVSPTGPVRTITEAVRRASAGDRIIVRAGTYREPTIIVDRPVEIEGVGRPVLDGEGERQIMTITADDVTVRGLRFVNTGASYVEDRAALRVAGARRCTIADNRFDDAFFGIYLAEASDCVVERNELHASASGEAGSGNGIHMWSSRAITVADNRISGHRDGIYLEFTHASEMRGNVSEHNLRYGLHFMYSNDCRYTNNVFRDNGSGVAVMYTKNVTMIGNRFERNWGGAAYGLLLKEISDSRLERNVFEGNTTGLLADGANRLQADNNQFIANGWALKLEASTQDGHFTRNDFVANTFDVVTNNRNITSTFAGNYWDSYKGYDLDHDGVGDVPHWPVRLFSLLAARAEPSLVLLRSAFVELLDAAERVLPVLTPDSVNDPRPAMHRISS